LQLIILLCTTSSTKNRKKFACCAKNYQNFACEAKKRLNFSPAAQKFALDLFSRQNVLWQQFTRQNVLWQQFTRQNVLWQQFTRQNVLWQQFTHQKIWLVSWCTLLTFWKSSMPSNYGILSTALYVATYINGNDERTRMIRRNIVRYTVLNEAMVFRDVSPVVGRRFPDDEAFKAAGHHFILIK
jgi:hypothetical protein